MSDNSTTIRPQIGWIGLGDQGAPMAVAVADSASFDLHIWARRQASLEVLGTRPFTSHATPSLLAAAVDILVLCVREDGDIDGILTEEVVSKLRPGAIVINQGTGLPGYAKALADRLAGAGVASLDAPVSGGNPAAVARRLTTMVGGSADAYKTALPLFNAYSAYVVHIGDPGSGQTAKLINNTLLMANQKNVQDVLRLAVAAELDINALIDLLLHGTGSSRALETLRNGVTPANADHLRQLQLIDMELYEAAMVELGLDSGDLTARAVTGADDLPVAAQIVADAAAS